MNAEKSAFMPGCKGDVPAVSEGIVGEEVILEQSTEVLRSISYFGDFCGSACSLFPSSSTAAVCYRPQPRHSWSLLKIEIMWLMGR